MEHILHPSADMLELMYRQAVISEYSYVHLLIYRILPWEWTSVDLSYQVFIYIFFYSILPPPGLLPVLGPLKWYMTPTLDAALLYVVHPDRVTTSVHRASPLYL